MVTTREQRSLFGEILDWMLAPLLLLWPMSVAITWIVAQNIANQPYDRELGQMVRMLARHVSTGNQVALVANAPFRLDALAAEMLRGDDVDHVLYQVTGSHGELLAGEPGLPGPGLDERPAVGDLRFRDDVVNNEPVRVAYLWLPAEPGGQGAALPMVQVAETLGKRSRLATEIIKGVILPQFVILPVAVLLVWFALARGIAPLSALQQRIRSRESHDLSPIDEHEAPEEVAPLVRAINDLLGRLDASIGRQKVFLADAAHQLKTPLAGLRTQAELAQRQIDAGRSSPEELKRSLQQIAHSSQRAAHMVNQLLAMARADDKEHVVAVQEVNIARLATETVRDFVPRALERRVDLGYEGPQPAEAGLRPRGQALLIRELIRNLVDNGLQYTGPGGAVTVRVHDDMEGQAVVLQVEDNGPGIPPEEREKVFRPFYRVLGSNVDGSGLGLAIVRRIAQQHDAEVVIEDAHPRTSVFPEGRGPGTRFTVRFAVQALGKPDTAVPTQPPLV